MRIAVAIATALALSLSFAVQANEEKIDYDHQEKWQGALDRAQSPIDIVTAQTVRAEDNEPLGLQLWHTRVPVDKAEDNGHAVQVNTHSTENMHTTEVMIRGRYFTLAQFHFHAESEHTIDAKHYPLEGHFVFKAQDGRLAVVGVMYQVGEANPAAQAVIEDLEAKDGEQPQPSIDIASLIPAKRGYYHYLGSLTTPPLTENVEWYVLPTPVTMSKEQMAVFLNHYRHNNRKTQPLNGRPVIRYEG